MDKMNDPQPKEYINYNCKSSCCEALPFLHMHHECDGGVIPLCPFCHNEKTCAQYYEHLKGKYKEEA